LQSQAASSSSSSSETALNDTAVVEAENERMLREELAEWSSEDFADKEKIATVLEQFEVETSRAFAHILKAPAFSSIDKDAQDELLRFLFNRGIDPFFALRDEDINNFVLYCEICNPTTTVVKEVLTAVQQCGQDINARLTDTLRALLLSKRKPYGEKALPAVLSVFTHFATDLFAQEIRQLLDETAKQADSPRWLKTRTALIGDDY
jgi:hypothetical protein